MMTRRTFMRSLGKGTFAIAVLGVAACASDSSSTTGAPNTEPTPTTGGPEPTATTGPPPTDPETTTAIPTTWERVDLGFVSAYIIARGERAVVVDTGVAGSDWPIEAALGRVGLGWDNVDHVIITHLHGDHQGSLGAVLTLSPDALGYAGEADLSGIESPRPLTAVGDGDEVFGLQIIETPGHTAGSISVLDPVGGVLVAGDALNFDGDRVTSANPQFTDDLALANESAAKLAGFDFEVLLTGHSEPVLENAASLVADYAASV